MLLLEGKGPAAALRTQIQSRAAALTATGRTPRLAAVLAGGDQASDLYLARKERLGRELGVAVEAHRLPQATEEELAALLRRLSLRADVDGILVEQPLPRSIRREAILHTLDPQKDVDGMTGRTAGLLTGEGQGPAPATPLAVMQLLGHYQIPLTGANVVIVGHSPVVGKPLALLMLRADATVTVCHKETRNLGCHTSQADILVVAAGVPGLITGSMVRPGAVVVDVGINRVGDRTVGDVDFEAVSRVAGALTPVPGGVGPLTTLTILQSTVAVAEQRGAGLSQAAD